MSGYAILVVETADRKIKLLGCPCERQDILEEADEITDVNGKVLDNWILPDIADYLERCIHSRVICLRVKAQKSEKVGNVRIRDTFLINVHTPAEEADMTQLSDACRPHTTTDPSATTKAHPECEFQKIIESPTTPLEPTDCDAMKDPKLAVNNNNNNHIVSNGAMRPHREMAVDVPDSFVGVSKTPPRYPPPQKPQQASSLKKNGLYRFSSEPPAPNHVRSVSSVDSAPSERKTPPTPRISELLQDQQEEKLVHLGQVQKNLQKIKMYRESFRKRQEEAREEEFLRSSMRGSQKMRALEKCPSGQENAAFLMDDEETPAPPDTKNSLTELYDAAALLDVLHNIEHVLTKTGFGESLLEVEKLFKDPEFQSLLSVHNKVQELSCFKCLPSPVCEDAQVISLEVKRALQATPSKDAKELLHLLSHPDFEGLMFSHDKVAAAMATPDVSEEEELLARLGLYPEENIKIVRVDKTNEPLGATVKNDGEAVIVGRIIKGGVAEKSGLLNEGDELLEVNGIELRGKSVNDVCDIMASMSGTLTFFIVPSQFEALKPQRETVIHLKAHFDYEPDDDLYIPCRELGMSFQKGDVLHVISQEDANWWQAYREGEEDQLLAGLVPSRLFQQQREMMKQSTIGEVKEKKTKKPKLLCAKRPHKRKKKKMFNSNLVDEYVTIEPDTDQVLTYEEVRLYYPRAHQKRPLVLIGPQKVGRHELRQRLMEDTNRFAAAVPHTSRTKKDSEVNGVDYFFISRAQFESDILAGRFVEHGEYQKSYYGTSLDAIRSVIEVGKTCVLNLHPQSLKILKKSDLMPYVVFIAPPSLEKLRVNCLKMDTAVKDDELKDIIEKAREMEEFFGHYFDLVLINMDLEKTYSELLHAVSLIEREPQWVPASWIKDDAP